MRLLRGVLSVVLMLFAAAGHAADGFYFGAVGALTKNSAPGFDNAINAGLVLGYEFLGVGVGDIAIEGVYTTSVRDGDLIGSNNWSADTLSGFGVFRSAGPIYLKAKAGLTNWDVKTSGTKTDGTDFSWGLGLGFSFALGQLEFEYSKIQDDINFYGITLNIKTPK